MWRAAFGFVGLGGALMARLLDAAEEESRRSCAMHSGARRPANKGGAAVVVHDTPSYTGVLQ